MNPLLPSEYERSLHRFIDRAIIEALAETPPGGYLRTGEIAEQVGRSKSAISTYLSRLCALGRVERVDYGCWRLTDEERARQ